MDDDKSCCMLEKITDFLIQVGEHCISCSEKTVTTYPIIPEEETKPKTYKRNIKISYLQKWITKGSFEFFTLEQFFNAYPKQKSNDRLNSHINNLIDKKIINQMQDGKFQVIRRKKI